MSRDIDVSLVDALSERTLLVDTLDPSIATVAASAGKITIYGNGIGSTTIYVWGTYDFVEYWSEVEVTVVKAPLKHLAVNIGNWTEGDSPSQPVLTGNTEGGAVQYFYKVYTAGNETYTTTVPTLANHYMLKAVVAETTSYLETTAYDDFEIYEYEPGPEPPGPDPPGPTPTTYTVTFEAGTGGTVDVKSYPVFSGTAISASGNVLTLGVGTFAKRATAIAQSGYEFDSWSVTTGTVTQNMTITASFKTAPVQPITKEVPNGAVTLPSEVVSALDIKDPAKLVLKIEKVTPKAPNVPADAVCFEITLTYDGKALTSFSPNTIEVVLKYTPPTGTDVTKLKVYFVSDDGKKVKNMNASYDSSKKGMMFKVSHLSVFAITQKSIEPVPPSLTSISVKTAPTKVSYTAGDKFDPTGLVLSLKYDDGSSKDLAYKGNESKFSFSPDLETSLKSTDKTVTITYEGKTTTQSITVSESPSGGDDNSMMIIIIVIIVLLLIVAIAFFVMKMRIKP